MLDHPTKPRGLLALMAAEGTPLDLKSVAKALASLPTGKSAKSPASKSPAGKGAKPQAPAKLSKPPSFWEPMAVVLWHPTWHCCNCGATGSGTPQIMLRERHRRSDLGGGRGGFVERLVAIPSPMHYSHLTREIEQGEPAQTRACPQCFAATPIHPQLRLPGIEVAAATPYIRPPMEKLFDDYAEMRIAASSGKNT